MSGGAAVATAPTAAPTTPNGIDVSWHNQKIDWPTVAGNKNIGFAFMKATEGTSVVDKTLAYNATEAKKAGLKTGYYHFGTLNQSGVAADAKAEADFFLNTISA